MPQRPSEIDVKLDLKLFSVSAKWRPNEREREAAWELYVELITRVAVVPLTDGIMREALNSIYSIFGEARRILRSYGPIVAEPKPEGQANFGYLAVLLLNTVFRPLLARWHPELLAWESSRPAGRSIKDHEAQWPLLDEMRRDLADVREVAELYSKILAVACGVPEITGEDAPSG